MDLKEVGWEIVDWIHLAWVWDQELASVNTIMNFQFHKIRAFLDKLCNY
jgi:hypothetical protein